MNQNWNWLNTSPWNGFSKWLLNSSVERQIHFQWSLILLFSFICKTNYRAFCTTITGIKTTLFHLMNFNSNWTEEAINWKIVQSSMPTYWTVISTPQMCNAIWNYQNVLSPPTPKQTWGFVPKQLYPLRLQVHRKHTDHSPVIIPVCSFVLQSSLELILAQAFAEGWWP